MKDFEAAKTTRLQQELTFGGIVAGYREGYTRSNNPFGILKLEDLSGSAEIPFFGRDFIEYAKYGRQNMFLLIKGAFSINPHTQTNTHFKITSISPLAEVKDNLVQSLAITLSLQQLDSQIILDLSSLLHKKTGNTSLYFKIEDPERQLTLSLASDRRKYAIDRPIIRYLEEHQITFEINK
jgi:DNA polymerase-3 subunit alpha